MNKEDIESEQYKDTLFKKQEKIRSLGFTVLGTGLIAKRDIYPSVTITIDFSAINPSCYELVIYREVYSAGCKNGESSIKNKFKELIAD
jgi:hypothetical protein